MTTKYLVFPGIEAQNFNATAGAYIAGVPQPTAICGLTHAFMRNWQASRPNDLGNIFASVLYAIGNYSGLGGQSRNPKYQFSQKSGVGSSPSPAMTDRPRASMSFSLIFEVDLQSDEALSDATLLDDLRSVFERLRLNGASLWINENPVFKDDVMAALKALPFSAFVLSDETSLLQAWANATPGLNVTKSIADLCARPRKRDEYKPRYVPFIAGVHRMTPLTQLAGSVNNNPHAYAEPVIGLGRFRSLASVKKSYRDMLDPQTNTTQIDLPGEVTLTLPMKPGVFWNYCASPQLSDKLHLVSASSD